MNRYKFAVNSLSEIHGINHYSSMVQKGFKKKSKSKRFKKKISIRGFGGSGFFVCFGFVFLA